VLRVFARIKPHHDDAVGAPLRHLDVEAAAQVDDGNHEVPQPDDALDEGRRLRHLGGLPGKNNLDHGEDVDGVVL
jgi:hypothetical protein